MFLLIFFTLVTIIVTLSYFWVRKKYSYFKDNGILYEEPIFPHGNRKGMITEVHPVYIAKRLYDKFKGKAPLCGVYRFFTPGVIILDLDLMKNIFIRDFDNFRNRGMYVNEKDDPLSAHLFNIEDNAWKNLRMKLTPVFTSGKMKMMFNTVLDISNNMIEQLKTESNLEMFEVKDMLAKFTTDVIGNVDFGLEMNAIKNPDSEFRKMGRKIFRSDGMLLLKFIITNIFQNASKLLGLRIFSAELTDFFMKIVRETIDYRTINKIERNDFMDLMIKLYAKKGEDGLTFNEITAQSFIFFIAGFETSSSTSTFVLYNLSLNQDIQEKLRSEIKAIIAKHNDNITYEAMNEMKYLQMVIDESLRLYGPVGTQMRNAENDYKVPNTDIVIRKGMQILLPTYCIHHDERIYPDPEKFDPERFNDENKANRHPMAFTPFGAGPRICIGERFGLMQTKIGLISLLLNFKFLPTEKTPVPMIFDRKSGILSPPGGMWLKIQKL